MCADDSWPGERIMLTVMLFSVPVLLVEAQPANKAPAASLAKTRAFFFTYGATVKDLPQNKKARIWLPVPANSPEQQITLEAKSFPARARYGEDPTYGNRILYLETSADKDGRISLLLTYRVVRREIGIEPRAAPAKPLQDKVQRFLQADDKVPIGGKPVELLKGKKVPTDPLESAKLFYDIVNQHMHYGKKGTGWGRGDALWACDSRSGNCTDFHSLFIALARSHKIPAKFEIGFSLPPAHGAGKIGGYHCWAWFLPAGKTWVPVDISEANRHPEKAAYFFGNLTEDRVAFSIGRDITLVPRQEGPPLNFFIYPYVEVDGRQVPENKAETVLSFQDIAK
jgi:transglutaminase-like putative cysteine protease